MKTIGLIYPINAKTELRRQELRESGKVFAEWLMAVGGLLGWKVYDYAANNHHYPEADIVANVVFGKVFRRRLTPIIAHRPRFYTADYENNLDLVRDLFQVLNPKEEMLKQKKACT